MSAGDDDGDRTAETTVREPREPRGPRDVREPRDSRTPRDAGDFPERSSTAESVRRALDDLLPEASVDSRWWYWIAAVPALFAVTLGFGIGAFVLALFGVALDVAGLAGLASFGGFILFSIGGVILAGASLLVAILFPVATYVDARAVEESNLDWRPDPVLYGLAAAAAVIATNFVLSVPLALYYLYRRHGAVGVP